ncbi:mucin-17 isoform X1 [Oryzias melastigma]|uniref:Mucin-17-like n=1 Tax=Oryzias melastigma TaxID=30732 RepID=A0A3B3DCA9_ORYME|nr:mucin-17 isoform X1 [Oryzias melastigma]XP_024155280.1 mucin-17 isoform X1 [Oryzias melastigma]XP_024155282.1 mucin-17 isoform X1 [Oryzias melastigma]XP_024155283.1 mucin-17 isoform X1 [Oryzias melastigma]XP_024155284.1 mucin-17 isoform X1 [Oryzias melastigma]XP_024155285.1 mucin-17 isoform X1 [Oryzias melastigma]
MVSKEPNHMLTGHTNGKSTLADKLPGTMTVRSVLLNRDSPDIESRLKRRRNRTHQVRFKDLEDGSSSSGNSATGDNNGHQRPATDCDSPHPLRKHGSRTPPPWSDHLRTGDQPAQSSVVGAVRGDMASTLEVVAAFLARAPPHPLTPGPTRRCWAPPQTNSLTLPMTRKPGSSTSTAIQTSPCLKKPPSISSTHTRSQSIGDSVGVDGDDEHDSQDEYLTHNHVLLPGSKEQSRPAGSGDRTAIERRSKVSRTESKSAVGVVKTSRHSCPPSVLHCTEPRHSASASSRDSGKRQGSSTPSVVRRRKRLSRTTSDPGKEVHYCTTPTQTESPSPSPLPSTIKLCTTQVQTESPSSPSDSKRCTTPSQTENHQLPPPPNDKKHTAQLQTTSSSSATPPNTDQHPTQTQVRSASAPPLDPKPSSPQKQPCNSLPTPQLTVPSSSVQIQSDSHVSTPVTQTPPITHVTTVPYCASSSPSSAKIQTPEDCTKPPCSSPSKSACNPSASNTQPIPSSIATVPQQPVPYYTIVSPPIPSTAVVCTNISSNPPTGPMRTCTSAISNLKSPSPLTLSAPTPIITPVAPPCDPTKYSTSVADQPPSHSTPPTNLTPCTFVTQTALSCTSISYYTTTHPSGPYASPINPTSSSYATVIQTVSHCNIPCQTLQNNPSAGVSTGLTPYSSPVPKLKCTSPPPLVKTYVSTLQNACATPTKAVPLYSSTFRAAPPYTPPSQAPRAQDKRGIRLPPPPPPPPPYTPRKTGNEPSGTAVRTPMLKAESKASDKDKEGENKKKEDVKCTNSPKLCERASSLKHRAQTPPVAVMKGERRSSSSSPAKACFKSSCLSSAQAQLGVLHKMLCSGANTRPNTPNSQHTLPSNQQGCSGARGCSVSRERPTAGPLSPTQADTLKQVQEILGGLMSGARCKLDPSRVTEKLLSPNGPLHDIRSLQNQLQSLEGVLETSQNTIKVLLDVIQDLEKKEAERDGRHSYRTGQDIENCGTCRDCACIIYSVEHDFRLQEGQVVRTWKVGDPPEGSPQTATPPPSTPHHQESPQTVQPPVPSKKNRKKCFWFL